MKSYSGSLKKRLKQRPLRNFGVVREGAIERATEYNRRVTAAEMRIKLFVLLDHFEISSDNPDCWLQLAVKLALEHVPGFQVERKVGAKPKWTIFNRRELRETIDCEKSKAGNIAGKGIAWACGILAKQEPWKSLVKGQDRAESLRSVYYKARRESKKA